VWEGRVKTERACDHLFSDSAQVVLIKRYAKIEQSARYKRRKKKRIKGEYGRKQNASPGSVLSSYAYSTKKGKKYSEDKGAKGARFKEWGGSGIQT